MLCLWKDISEEICFPWKVRENYQSHSVKGENLVTQRKTNAFQTGSRLVLVAGELSKDEYRSGDRSGTSGNTVGHSLQKRTWSLSGLCVQTWKSHSKVSRKRYKQRMIKQQQEISYWGVKGAPPKLRTEVIGSSPAPLAPGAEYFRDNPLGRCSLSTPL